MVYSRSPGWVKEKCYRSCCLQQGRGGGVKPAIVPSEKKILVRQRLEQPNRLRRPGSLLIKSWGVVVWIYNIQCMGIGIPRSGGAKLALHPSLLHFLTLPPPTASTNHLHIQFLFLMSPTFHACTSSVCQPFEPK